MPEKRVAYEVIAHEALSGIRVQAPSLQRLFIDAALALCDYRVSFDLVKEQSKQTIRVEGSTPQELLRNWLNTTAQLFAAEQFLPYRIVFTQFDGKKIESTLIGETYERTRHGYALPFEQVLQSPFELRELGSNEGFGAVFYLK